MTRREMLLRLGRCEDPIDLSIEKWRDIVKQYETRGVEAGLSADEASRNCALCERYMRNTPKCNGCPVREKTGKPYCADTPYANFDEWLIMEDSSNFEVHLKHARDMLQFLEDLKTEDSDV